MHTSRIVNSHQAFRDNHSGWRMGWGAESFSPTACRDRSPGCHISDLCDLCPKAHEGSGIESTKTQPEYQNARSGAKKDTCSGSERYRERSSSISVFQGGLAKILLAFAFVNEFP